jgi:DNA gyrase subunit A
MSLKKGDELISMDILPSQVVDAIAAATGGEAIEGDIDETAIEVADVEVESTDVEAEITANEEVTALAATGPWVLVVTTNGFGKRVPVNQFRLQRRAGMGVMATKFKKKGDRIAALRVVNADEEMMMVTSRGIIIRQAVNAISHQSRMATGVRVQKLDSDDAIFAVALVPPGEGDSELLEEEE